MRVDELLLRDLLDSMLLDEPTPECEHPADAIKEMSPTFPGVWACCRCGRKMPAP